MWDKVYQKLTDVEEETWLLRAVESTALFFSSEVEKAEQLRFVYRFIHCAPVLIETRVSERNWVRRTCT